MIQHSNNAPALNVHPHRVKLNLMSTLHSMVGDLAALLVVVTLLAVVVGDSVGVPNQVLQVTFAFSGVPQDVDGVVGYGMSPHNLPIYTPPSQKLTPSLGCCEGGVHIGTLGGNMP